MSEKPVQRTAIVCDGCGYEMEEHPEPKCIVVNLESKLAVHVHFPNGTDFCEKCQVAAIGKAAHIVGAVKTRGRAAQRAGEHAPTSDSPAMAPPDQRQTGVPDFGGDTRVETHSEPEANASIAPILREVVEAAKHVHPKASGS